ncbi:hypothetical protein [Novipirellula rosea]|uniref:Uncharacterized protein n=1 Tax=Novipirellula rosea TaxID=1031540 RepID=A0ABP8M6P9_9BACT
MTRKPMFKNGKPLFSNGKPSFCETDCSCDGKCPSCCSTITWGSFNDDGDLEVTLSGDDYDMTVVLVMPVKNSRKVCGDDEVEIIQTFALTGSSGSYRARVQWDRAWLFASTDADDKVEDGIVEWATPSETSTKLTFWDCWHEYNTQWGEIVVSADNVGETIITMTDCPSSDCCPHDYECADCCLYLTSPKILADNVGPYTEEEACSVANEELSGEFIFWDDDPTRARMKVAVTPSGGDKRTICPETYEGTTGNAGNTLLINVSLVPSTLDPSVTYENQVCIQYDPNVWEVVTGPEGNAACENPVCLPVSEELERGFELQLKCKDFGPNAADLIDTITITASDETVTTPGYDKHGDFCVKLQFGYCGYTDPCCLDPVECEDCCVVFDYSSGFDTAENDGGQLEFTLDDCSQDPPVTLTITLPEKLCTGDEFDIGLSLSAPISPEPTICVGWTSELEFEGSTPEADSESEDEACWTPDDTDISASMKVKCVDGIDAQTITITFAGKTGIIEYKGCNPSANCCCDTYVPCCGTCYFPVSADQTGLITDLVVTVTDGSGDFVEYSQNGAPTLATKTVNIAVPGCPTNLETVLDGSNLQYFDVTVTDSSTPGIIGRNHFFWITDFCGGPTGELTYNPDFPMEPGSFLMDDIPCSGAYSGSYYDSENDLTYECEMNINFGIDIELCCDDGFAGKMEEGECVRKKRSEFPDGFFDGEEF